MAETLGHLTQLKINGYKSIKSLDLELRPLNIIIGANGVGKSNFIGFFKFMKKIVDKDLQLYVAQQGGANKILYFGRKTTEKISFTLDFPLQKYSCILSPTVSDKFIIEEEMVWEKDDELIWLTDGVIESEFPQDRKLIKYLKNVKVYHFHDTGITAKVKQTSNINDCEVLAPDGANLSAFLRCVMEFNPKAYKQIVKTIQRVAPFFQDFILEPERYNQDTIRLKWKHKGTDDYFDANDLSDGTLRFILLTTLLLQPNLPTIILLDEPELGLHPFALKLLASMFRKVSRKTQIIASTQSATLADEFDIEDLIVVDRVDNHSEFKRLNPKDYEKWLEEYSLGDIWQKNLIGGVPSNG